MAQPYAADHVSYTFIYLFINTAVVGCEKRSLTGYLALNISWFCKRQCWWLLMNIYHNFFYRTDEFNSVKLERCTYALLCYDVHDFSMYIHVAMFKFFLMS